jgi:hypothetical protein
MSFDPVKFYRSYPAGGNDKRGDWLRRCLTDMIEAASSHVERRADGAPLSDVDGGLGPCELARDHAARSTTPEKPAAWLEITEQNEVIGVCRDNVEKLPNGWRWEPLYTAFATPLIALPVSEWHEDTGNVIWWRVPVEEPPWVGTPLDSDWTDDYYTHFTPLVIPANARADGGKA